MTDTFSKVIHMEFRMQNAKLYTSKKAKSLMNAEETYEYFDFRQATLLQDKQGKGITKDQYLKRVNALLSTGRPRL